MSKILCFLQFSIIPLRLPTSDIILIGVDWDGIRSVREFLQDASQERILSRDHDNQIRMLVRKKVVATTILMKTNGAHDVHHIYCQQVTFIAMKCHG